MNIATILAIAIVILILGVIMLRRSKRNKAIGSLETTGMILIYIGAFGIVWFAINFIMFLLIP
jgi:hypothetical protein